MGVAGGREVQERREWGDSAGGGWLDGEKTPAGMEARSVWEDDPSSRKGEGRSVAVREKTRQIEA